MTGRIPKYGANFRRESVPYDPSRAILASRRYVLKVNPDIFIRSTNDSEHWMIYVTGPSGEASPVGKRTFDTFGEAMARAIAFNEFLKG